MRLFVGIPLSKTVVDELNALCVRLRVKAGNLRWSASESWHITLQFLGTARPDQFACLTARLAEVHAPAFAVQLGVLGVFDRAGVFFADVVLTPELVALQQSIVGATEGCGFLPEARPFHPHITLARSKREDRGRPLRQLKADVGAQSAFTSIAVREFLLYESHLSPAGSKYEVRARFPLE
jgi:RNA 2',3'-cyclic 3'-phosphodiesterase